MTAMPTTPLGTDPNSIPVHDARALVGDGVLTYIQLDDQTYTLRITRAGKLILTK
ncbi:MAG: hypothetical protein CSA70_01700 [Rhodobacterales bacterium]|nr:MAG: hypothetical protein CSA70_01700 [Rhodobacterales bacterium]